MEALAQHLAADVLAHRQGPSTVQQRDLLATPRRGELDAAGAGLSAETAMPYTPWLRAARSSPVPSAGASR